MNDAAGAHRVRIASYNVRGLKDDHAAVVDVIRAIAPDVLLLQEVPRHPLSGHRIANFADELGLTWFGGARFRMSTTLMTDLRLDVLDARHGKLPTRRFDEPRGFGMATVRLPGHRPFVACSVHLSLRETDRMPETEAVLAAIGSADAVVGGDLNEEATGTAWRRLAGRLPEVSERAPSYSAANPHKQIDVVFASSGLTGQTPRLDLEPALLAAATDHLPVVVDLDVSSLAE
ncbi:endonuclease/exonuclease/phosphatase family protein [Flexivirga caeni]|uniref:Endonuclease/exonuclease/phosphatase domain-containing protein n=1 Tax=Flexivirga caeni TaxID=2294115 RepID=A0A3M9MFT7_9MICO|nr:endonuclease/exonuclease/phosphatase family protein [Flexivirga caeni]RNI24412.1 hypothetical protein EFY87_05505 [Flexivirga caeni]